MYLYSTYIDVVFGIYCIPPLPITNAQWSSADMCSVTPKVCTFTIYNIISWDLNTHTHINTNKTELSGPNKMYYIYVCHMCTKVRADITDDIIHRLAEYYNTHAAAGLQKRVRDKY